MLSSPAPAKLNLGLHVLRRRADGYHDLETVFLPIEWADHLEARPAHSLSLTCSDATLPTDAGNLVVKAAVALAAHVGSETGAALHLDKRVPYGAGLGGGSSDAAAALRLLAGMWEIDVPPEALHALAAGLGSDVPFFLLDGPAVATGRGEELTPLVRPDGTPYACPFWVVVAVPPVHVSTPEAYRLVVPRAGDRPDLAAAVLSDDLGRWRRDLVNDFQAPVARAYPAIGQARQALTEAGAGYAAMSGSGSAVFGMYEREADARAGMEAARQAGASVWLDTPRHP